ncbi:cysteine proteinases superfamily protein [Striga asiatica]|uniref:Cysteine proteinases superfamily protein n=1 Tax=Striga asiatica TaxID=4170 RepID=A0A5A7PSL9_STRAF|nr:cysteine proteinases superfamily protein [Striga asiatica]
MSETCIDDAITLVWCGVDEGGRYYMCQNTYGIRWGYFDHAISHNALRTPVSGFIVRNPPDGNTIQLGPIDKSIQQCIEHTSPSEIRMKHQKSRRKRNTASHVKIVQMEYQFNR